MKRQNNYEIAARQAQQRFLTYDQQALIRKLSLEADQVYLYSALFGKPYRIHRQTGRQQRLENRVWVDGNSFEEVLTLLDLVCDSREDRQPSGQYCTIQELGRQFHQNLAENRPNAAARTFDQAPAQLAGACRAMGGVPFPGADVGYVLPVFEDLTMVVQLWLGDEEFAPRLRYLWDANALAYLRYETIWYAVGLLEQWLLAWHASAAGPLPNP